MADQFTIWGAKLSGFTHAVVFVLEQTAALGLRHAGASAEEESSITRAALHTGLAAVLRG